MKNLFYIALPFQLVVLCAFNSQLVFAQDIPRETQIAQTASANGIVQKWMHPIRLVVLYDEASFETEINILVENFNTQISGFPGISEVEYFNLDQIQTDLYGHTIFRKFHFEQDGIARVMGAVIFDDGGENTYLQADIFVFLVKPETGVLFGALAAPINEASKSRRFASLHRDSVCYGNVISVGGELETGLVFIESDDPAPSIVQCLYGRISAVIGGLNLEAESNLFTFGNREGPALDLANDFSLLNAIYADSVQPGDPVELVVEAFLAEVAQ